MELWSATAVISFSIGRKAVKDFVRLVGLLEFFSVYNSDATLFWAPTLIICYMPRGRAGSLLEVAPVLVSKTGVPEAAFFNLANLTNFTLYLRLVKCISF